MKLNAVASAFKKNKSLYILDDSHGNQWLSNRAAYYLITGLPKLVAENVLTMFDIPEDKRSDWNCYEREMIEYEKQICCDGCGVVETPVELMDVEISWQGKKFLFFQKEKGNEVYAIDEKLLKPICADEDYLRFFARKTVDGKYTAITCHNGLELKAVILPAILHDEKMLKELNCITSFLSKPYEVFEMPEENPEEDDEGTDFEQETLE